MRILTLVTFSSIFVTISGFACLHKNRGKAAIGGSANQQYGNSGAAAYTSMNGLGNKKFLGSGGYYQSGNNNWGFGQSSPGFGEMNNINRNMLNQGGYEGQPGLSRPGSQFNQRGPSQTGPSQYGPNVNQFAGPDINQGNSNQFGQNRIPNGAVMRGPDQNRPISRGPDGFNQGAISNSQQNEIASRGGFNAYQFAGPDINQGNSNQFGQNRIPNGAVMRGPDQNRPISRGPDGFNQGTISNSQQNQIASRGGFNANQFAGPDINQGNINQSGQNMIPNGAIMRGPDQYRPISRGPDGFNQDAISNSQQNEIASRGGINRGFEPEKNLRQLPGNQNLGTDTQTVAQQRSADNSIGGGSIENGYSDQRSIGINSEVDSQALGQQRRIIGNVEGRFDSNGLIGSQTNSVQTKKSNTDEKEQIERNESDQRDRKDDRGPDEMKRVNEDRKMSSESSRRSGSSPDLGSQIGKMLFKVLLNPGR